MCGRFVLEPSPDQLMKVYGLSSTPDVYPRYNITPSQKIAVVRQHNGGDRELAYLQWGLIPSWAKDPAVGYTMINARSETVHEEPSFRNALRARRCIIPASGFYEWEQVGKEKIPHYTRLRDGGVMSLAGIWEHWKSPEGEELETCAILTTAANSMIKMLHDRMPVLLHREEFKRWLSRDNDDVGHLAELFHPYPAEQLQEYIVSTDVNSPSHDSSECIVPA